MSQNSQKVIGLTGGIASGKSTVSNIIKDMGYNVIDADVVSREVVKKGKPAYMEVVEYFGREILNKNGDINRKRLGNIIFNNNAEREKLNAIVHPYILNSIKGYIEENKDKGLVFVDIPLLIEVLDDLKSEGISFDEIWLVYVDEDTQVKRLIERDKINKEGAIKRIRAQMPMDTKVKYATKIIDNRGDKESLETKVKKIIKEAI